jgi:hypothetical protein
MDIKVQALLLADHIYRDHGSGKFVIAGTFHQLSVGSFPASFGRFAGVFVSLSNVIGKKVITLHFVDATTNEVLLDTRPLEIFGNDPHLPIEFAVEVPPLPLPRPGMFWLQLKTNGILIGSIPVFVYGPPENRK